MSKKNNRKQGRTLITQHLSDGSQVYVRGNTASEQSRTLSRFFASAMAAGQRARHAGAGRLGQHPDPQTGHTHNSAMDAASAVTDVRAALGQDRRARRLFRD